MTKFLYLIGAGASAMVLPTINSYSDEKGNLHYSFMEELLGFTSRLKDFGDYKIYYDLCLEAKDFTTPDTFAKYLYSAARDSDYLKFKIVISAYFFWKERISTNDNNGMDIRVISFLATISKNNGEFPENVKILSWNCDIQFLKAVDKANLHDARNAFLHNFLIYPFSIRRLGNKSDISLMPLNGIAGYTYSQQHNKILDKSNQEYLSSLTKIDLKIENGMEIEYKIKKIFDLFLVPDESILISYAWEKELSSQREYQYVDERLEYVKSIARTSEYLIVIGYSFPFFNREIDQVIFSEMPDLKGIYFQDPKLTGEFLYSQFNLNKDRVFIRHVPDVKNYYVPYEL